MTDLINRCHEIGKLRFEKISQAQTPEDWSRLWDKPQHEYKFQLGNCWTQCCQYRVADFYAEFGFFIDVLGLNLYASGDGYAMFSNPSREFYFAIEAAKEGQPTLPEASRLEFMVRNIQEIAEELPKRGVVWHRVPSPEGHPESRLYKGEFHTPNGVPVSVWGMVS